LFVSDYAGDLLLPPLLKRLQAEAPRVSVRVQLGGGNTLDPFEVGRAVDVAIACAPNCFKGFFQQRLFTDRDACAVRRAHPITSQVIGQEEFLKTKHVAVVGREFTEDPVDKWLRDEGRERNVALSVPHYLQALHVVAQSDLIAVIPERLIRAYASVFDLDAMAIPMDVGTFDEYLLHPATSHTDAGCMWFRGVLNDIAKSQGPLNSQQILKISNRQAIKKAALQTKRLRKTAL